LQHIACTATPNFRLKMEQPAQQNLRAIQDCAIKTTTTPLAVIRASSSEINIRPVWVSVCLSVCIRVCDSLLVCLLLVVFVGVASYVATFLSTSNSVIVPVLSEPKSLTCRLCVVAYPSAVLLVHHVTVHCINFVILLFCLFQLSCRLAPNPLATPVVTFCNLCGVNCDTGVELAQPVLIFLHA